MGLADECRVAQIPDLNGRRGTQVRTLLPHPGSLVRVERGDPDRRALGCEPERNGATDPVAGARHEGHLAVETPPLLVHPTPPTRSTLESLGDAPYTAFIRSNGPLR